MKFETQRTGFRIIPEGVVDEAFIEDTIGLKSQGDAILLIRAGDRSWYELTTDPYPAIKETTIINKDGTCDLSLDLPRDEILRIQREATAANLTVEEYIVAALTYAVENKENKNV